jgi:Restriction endonuclease BglII
MAMDFGLVPSWRSAEPRPSGVPDDITDRYVCREWRNAIAVLRGAYPDEWDDLLAVLRAFKLCRTALQAEGGNKTVIAKAIDEHFTALGWQETDFDTRVSVAHHPRHGADEIFEYKSPTHKVDSFKNHVGVELEWNNKDTFFDRDLNNFRLLFELRVIGVGVIITRGEDVRELAISLGRRPGTYAATTTRWSTLVPRMEGGGGGGCPLLAFAITKDCYDADC